LQQVMDRICDLTLAGISLRNLTPSASRNRTRLPIGDTPGQYPINRRPAAEL